MDKVFLGNTGIEVSKIGFGVLPMGASQKNLPLKEGAELISYALKRGINFFDTAQYYDTYRYMEPGFSGSQISPVVMSKCLMPGYSDMMQAINEARRELRVAAIDIFLLHEVRSEQDLQSRSGALSALVDAKKSGLIKACGLSTHHEDVCMMASCVDDIDVVFPLINKDGLGIRNGSEAGSAEGMIKAIEECHLAQKGVVAMKVFGGGNLSREYVECLDFVNAINGVESMVIGFTRAEEIDRAIEYQEGRLDRAYVPDTKDKKMFVSQDDCEGCGACRDRCPNKAIKINKSGLSEIDHSLCITCGYCAPVCPVRALIMY